MFREIGFVDDEQTKPTVVLQSRRQASERLPAEWVVSRGVDDDCRPELVSDLRS